MFLHEAGHALIDVLDIPVTGLEEDAADQFATVYATSLGDGWQWIAYDGSVVFEMFAKHRGNPAVGEYWGKHALLEQRQTNILCWLYGYDEEEFVTVEEWYPESADRLEQCGYEYHEIKSSWEKLLEPFLKL